MNVWDILPTPGKVPGESIDPILQIWRMKNFGDKWSQWVDFIEELWPRGRWHWRIKKNFSDTSYNRLQRLTTVLQTFATICGKMNSQRNFKHVQNFFATRNTPCDNKNCLRTCLQPFTNPNSWRIQNSLRSQAFAAQCDIPFTEAMHENVVKLPNKVTSGGFTSLNAAHECQYCLS